MAPLTNCLFYAWSLWRYTKFDWFCVRKSHWGWFPHFAVIIELPDGTLVKKEYVPREPSPQRFPPLCFDGEYRTTYYTKDEK